MPVRRIPRDPRAILALALCACAAPGAIAAERPRVIELFTSQGCSSCPAADRLMTKMAQDPKTIVMSYDVDYWDYIGWKDTYGSPAFTARQKAYAVARGDGHVYTPQAVVDGLHHAVGSDPMEIENATQLAAGEQGAMSVPIRLTRENGRLVINVGAASDGAPRWGACWIVHIATSRTVSVRRGENAGHALSYTNVVRGMDKVGNWNGEAARYEVDPSSLMTPDSDAYVVMLQASSAGKPGSILAAVKGEGF